MMAANFPMKGKFVAIVIYLFRVFIFSLGVDFCTRLVSWSVSQFKIHTIAQFKIMAYS